MMNQIDKIGAMEGLLENVGETVSVNYIDQFNKQKSITGKLRRVEPYVNITIDFSEKVPEELRGLNYFKGKETFEQTQGIPFLGSPDAIISILAKDGSLLYDNKNVFPFYNPFFFPNVNKDGNLRIGVNHEAGEAYTKQIRELSFGKHQKQQSL